MGSVTDGRRVLRAAYAVAVDQPGTTAVSGTAATLRSRSRSPRPARFRRPGEGSGHSLRLAPSTVDPVHQRVTAFVERERAAQLATDVAVMVGYLVRAARIFDLAQPQPAGERRPPFPALSPSSPIRPGRAARQHHASREHGLFELSRSLGVCTKRLARGLQFDTSYTWSKSLDTNSLNSSGFAVQDGYDIPNQYGPSDFDARHRFVLSATYQLPFTGHALTRDWQIADDHPVAERQSRQYRDQQRTLNGMPNTVSPDRDRPDSHHRLRGSWFDPSAFAAVNRFGNLGRNVLDRSGVPQHRCFGQQGT